MSGRFRTPVDICNRALDHCGADRIDIASGFTEDSLRASLCSAVYDQLRLAELRRNVWRFAKKWAVLRAIDDNTRILSPAMWVAGTTYFVGSIVSDETGQLWISMTSDNLGNEPQISLYWQEYFGPMSVSLYDDTAAYSIGELVYTTPGDGSYRVFMSLENANDDDPETASAWDSTKTYKPNDMATYLSVAYMSSIDFNLNQTPVSSPSAWTTTFTGGTGSVKWRQIGGVEFPSGVALVGTNIVYPLSTGPYIESSNRNIYRLPANYLRPAPPDPKAGSFSWLGSPSGLLYNDWNFQGDYFVTSEVGPIPFAFVADTIDVTAMDPMFCEGLGARVGLEICERLTQSSEKLKTIASIYEKFMGEARTVNGIEVGAEEPPIDDYLACRL